MKKNILLLGAAILTIALIAIIYVLSRNNNSVLNEYASQIENNNQPSQIVDSSQSDNKQYQTQSDNQNEVTIDVTPKQLGTKEEKNIFSVSFNTHSVNLDFDFTKIMILSDDLGNIYPSLEWTGDRGLHHLNGDIVFPKLNPKAKGVKLQINGIGGVNRNFEWSLN